MSNEERIVAWLDGELDEAEAQSLERELEHDATLRALVERWSANDRQLKALGELVMASPPPPAMAALVQGAELPTKPSASILSFDEAQRNRAAARAAPSTTRWFKVTALAASLAFGALVLQQWRGGGSTDPFQLALDTTPSREQAVLGDGVTMQPVVSFASVDGRYCREYLLSSPGKEASGIACHADGEWTKEVEVPLHAQPDANDEIVTAGGESSPKIEEAYNKLGGDNLMNSEAEKYAIKNNWLKN